MNRAERGYRGRDWTSIELRRKLLSPTYAGIRMHKGVEVPATWEAIFTAEEHQALKAILGDPARLTQRGSDPKYLLTGIAQCGVCGARLARRKNKHSNSYACSGKFCVSRSMTLVDELVEGVVVARLSRPDIAEALKADEDPRIGEAFAEARTIRERLSVFEQKAIAGELEPDEYTRLRDGLRERLAAVEAIAESASGASPLPAQIAGPDAAELWAELPVESKRDVVRALFRIFVDRAPSKADIGDYSLIRVEWRE